MGGVFAGLWLGLIVLLFGSSAEKVPLAVIGGMLTVVGVELIRARIPSAKVVWRTGEWGSIAALAITFLTALFIPLQYTIFLGAGLSLLLYVVAASKKLSVQQAVRLDDGGWETRDVPETMVSNAINMFVVQGLDFFAEVPALEDDLPSARGVTNAAVVLVLRDLRTVSSTAVRWLERYTKSLQEEGSVLMLADVNPQVMDVLKKSGVMEIVGEGNVFPATTRVLEAEQQAWEAAQKWLNERGKSDDLAVESNVA
jgi:SulP family sulfate permease